VPVAETERPAGREREGVAVAEIEPAAAGAREREIVGEAVPAGRMRVLVADIEPRERVADAVAVTLPPAEDGNGVCAHPDETANAKKNRFLIILYLYYTYYP
jgi:hypothetical protein